MYRIVHGPTAREALRGSRFSAEIRKKPCRTRRGRRTGDPPMRSLSVFADFYAPRAARTRFVTEERVFHQP